MTWGKLYWPYWIVLTSVTFLGPEIIALVTNVQNTLSDYSRFELNVTRATQFSAHSIAWWVSLVAWLMFVVVITLHIWWAEV